MSPSNRVGIIFTYDSPKTSPSYDQLIAHNSLPLCKFRSRCSLLLTHLLRGSETCSLSSTVELKYCFTPSGKCQDCIFNFPSFQPIGTLTRGKSIAFALSKIDISFSKNFSESKYLLCQNRYGTTVVFIYLTDNFHVCFNFPLARKLN